MPTRKLYFPGLHHTHYSELSAGPPDASMPVAHQRDNRTDHQHGAKPGPRRRFDSQHQTMLEDVEKLAPTAAVVAPDNADREDVGQPERAMLRHERERRASPDRPQCRTQASTVAGLPRTGTARSPLNGANQSYILTGATVPSQDHPELAISLDEYHQLPQAERHRLRSLLPPPIPLVPKEERQSKGAFLGRLNPFRRMRGVSVPASYTTVVFIPSENSGRARRRSLARRGQ